MAPKQPSMDFGMHLPIGVRRSWAVSRKHPGISRQLANGPQNLSAAFSRGSGWFCFAWRFPPKICLVFDFALVHTREW